MLIALLVVVSCAIGCQAKKAAAVEEDIAMNSLKTTLDAWQNGKSKEELSVDDRPIVAQDLDWTNGKKLKSYKVLKQTRRDANLIVDVQLEIIDETSGSARQSSVEATYVVGTSPEITVFRDMFRGTSY